MDLFLWSLFRHPVVNIPQNEKILTELLCSAQKWIISVNCIFNLNYYSVFFKLQVQFQSLK